MDLVQLTQTPPPNVDYVFFHHCFIVLFQFLDIMFTLVTSQYLLVDLDKNEHLILLWSAMLTINLT